MTRTIALLSLALFVALCGPALCGLVYTADDLGAFHLPLRDFYAHALANGDSFDWCPHLFGGVYLTGEGQAGTYHPLHWALYRFLPLDWGWNLECVASYPFMFAGMWLLMRRRGFGRAEAMFAAMAFTFCGFNLLHFVHVNAVAVVAHVPWLLYAIDRLNDAVRVGGRGTRGSRGLGPPYGEVALIGVLTGSQLLLGYPQYVLYTLLAEGLFLAFIVREPRDAGGARQTVAVMASWAFAKLVGLALGAVQVLPTLEALGDSVRHDADASFAAWGSLHPFNAVQLISPYLFETRVVGQNTHELNLYVGVAPLLLAAIAMANRRLLPDRAGQQTVFRFALALIVTGSLLAVGSYGPLHRLLTAVPLVGSFRFPCRATVLIQLGIGLLAAIGFALVCRTSSFERQSIRTPGKTFAALLLASVALAGTAPILWPEFVAAPQLVGCGPLLLLLGLLLVRRAAVGRRWALPVLVVFMAIDLGVYGLTYGVYRGATSLDDYVAQTSAPSHIGDTRVALDLAPPNGEGIRAGNQILLRGFSRIDGYAGLEPARQLNYRAIDALRSAGVKIVSPAAHIEDEWRLSATNDGWLEVPDPLPRVRLVKPFFDEVETAPPAAGSVQIISDRPGEIIVIAASPEHAILALTESYHRGWTASAGGTTLKTLRIHGDFLGCQFPPGTSAVEFRFAPASLQYGRAASVCGLGFLGLLLAMSRLSGRRSRTRQSSGSQNSGESSYPRDG
ncbi:MAG: hypothetical protein WD894_00160 [Pirellulales bacterium]